MKTLKKYHGVVVPMVTPVSKDGSIDTVAVERIVDNMARFGVAPLIMGTTGEGNSVSTEGGVQMIAAANWQATASASNWLLPSALSRPEPT